MSIMDTKKPSGGQGGGQMPLSAEDSPKNWPTLKKVYVSLVSFCFAFTIAYGLTVYTAGLMEIQARFDVSMNRAILGFSLYLFGIALAPIYTPHLSELFGRTPVYFVSIFVSSMFTLGTGFSKNFATLAITRSLAGFFGGPCLVLIEGTFADVWADKVTGTYYAFLALASYAGTGFGPLIGGFVVHSMDWRWAMWTTLMLSLVSMLLGLGMPETYPRQIARNIAKRAGRPHNLPPAQSGSTLPQMIKITVIHPLLQLLAEPIVILSSLYLGLNFAVIFQFFITVPAVLGGVYKFSIQKIGVAFCAAIGGAIAAAITGILIDKLVYRRRTNPRLEFRLLPAMVGSFGLTLSLFWIAYTARPDVDALSPIFGTALYVWGNMCVLEGIIPYLFYAYPAPGTLSALTAAACVRIALGGFLPLVIIRMFNNLTGRHALVIFGSISAFMGLFPFVLFIFGKKLRETSKYRMKDVNNNAAYQPVDVGGDALKHGPSGHEEV